MDQARKLLDELMGTNRNKLSTEPLTRELKFYDRDVCPYYLVGFCPHDLFVNTKSDLGPCLYKFHEESLKADFMVNGEEYRKRYEQELLDYLLRLVNDLDRRIKRNYQRLSNKPSEDTVLANPNKDINEEKIALLEVQMQSLLQKIEECGEEGRVQEAQELHLQVEKIKFDIEKVKTEMNPLLKNEKEMEVCLVCGAYLVINDVSKRLDSHFEGRQHLGYQKVREELKRLQEKYQSSKAETDSGRQSANRDRQYDRYTSTSYQYNGSRRRGAPSSRSRSRERHRRSHSRDKAPRPTFPSSSNKYH